MNNTELTELYQVFLENAPGASWRVLEVLYEHDHEIENFMCYDREADERSEDSND
jgi:hypothetical protein